MKAIVDGMPKQKGGRKVAEWWTEELEKMMKDVKSMRWRGNEGCKLARNIARNTILQTRYKSMKEGLSKAKDPYIFRMIKNLERKRSLPPMMRENGIIATDHSKISDMIANQLNPGKEEEWNQSETDINITLDDMEKGLKMALPNTASGIDNMSYPFLRFWIAFVTGPPGP